jgi:hypothetical protein
MRSISSRPSGLYLAGFGFEPVGLRFDFALAILTSCARALIVPDPVHCQRYGASV